MLAKKLVDLGGLGALAILLRFCLALLSLALHLNAQGARKNKKKVSYAIHFSNNVRECVCVSEYVVWAATEHT